MKGNFEKIISGDQPVLVDFHAEWCGPCKTMNPIIKQVAGHVRGKVRVLKIDVDKNPSLAERFQIRGVPTLALFQRGQLIWQQSGVMTKQAIIQALDQKVASW